MGDIWGSLQYLGRENIRKVVFIMVNAEKEQDLKSDQIEKTLSSGRVLSSVTNIPIIRYNFETVELLKENFKQWADEIRSQRCGASKKLDKVAPSPSDSDYCADIKFYLVEVDFEALPDKSERSYLNRLPTSFHLPPEAVDRLRDAARRLLKQSPEFQRLLSDLR